MRHCFLLFLILLGHLYIQAAVPTYKLSGNVADRSGESIPYATITIGNGKVPVMSDAEGVFELKLPAGDYKGVATATGYKPATFEVKLTQDRSIKIVLDEDAVALKGVSVYGKSTAKRLEDGAFSVNAVEISPNLNKMVTLNDIVDRTAGVKVRREGGAGSDFDLTINGMSGNSINSTFRVCAGNGTCNREHVVSGYGAPGISQGKMCRTAGSCRRTWADHPAVHYHGCILYDYKQLCRRYVQGRHYGRDYDCCGTGRNQHLLRT